MGFTTDNNSIKKNNYYVFLTCATASPAITNQLVGGCLAEPSITEEKGEDVKLNDGTSPVISKNCGVSFTLVNVDQNNYELLKSCINKEASVVLTTNAAFSGTLATGDWKIDKIMIFPQLTIKGNAVNQIEVTGTKEVAATDITTVTTA